jgi:hypothetical protein
MERRYGERRDASPSKDMGLMWLSLVDFGLIPGFKLIEQGIRTRSVEAQLAFFQEPGKAVFRDAGEASQVPLRLVPNVHTALYVAAALRREGRAVIDARVMKLKTSSAPYP